MIRNGEKDQRKIALIIALMSSFVSPFMISAVNIALPSIEEAFSLNTRTLSWVVTSFLLSSGIFLVPSGKLADIHNKKSLFLIGTAVFSFASVATGLAFDDVSLIIARVIQGIGGAIIMTTGLVILISVYPKNERGKVLGLTVAAVYTGLSSGPFIGGFLTQYLGWRSIFLIPPVLSLFVLFLAWKKLTPLINLNAQKSFDWPGTIIYSLFLFFFIYGATKIPETTGFLMFFAGIVLLFVFAKREISTPYPVFEVALFLKNKLFAFSNIAALINYGATFAITFLLSLYFQNTRGMEPREAGLILVTQPIVQAVLSPFTGRLSDRISASVLASLGMLITSVGLSLMIFVTTESAISYFIVALVVLGVGFAFFSSPNMNSIMTSVDRQYYGLASASAATMRLMGQMLSMTGATVIFTLYSNNKQMSEMSALNFIEAFRISFIIFTIFCLIGIYFSYARDKK